MNVQIAAFTADVVVTLLGVRVDGPWLELPNRLDVLRPCEVEPVLIACPHALTTSAASRAQEIGMMPRLLRVSCGFISQVNVESRSEHRLRFHLRCKVTNWDMKRR